MVYSTLFVFSFFVFNFTLAPLILKFLLLQIYIHILYANTIFFCYTVLMLLMAVFLLTKKKLISIISATFICFSSVFRK